MKETPANLEELEQALEAEAEEEAIREVDNRARDDLSFRAKVFRPHTRWMVIQLQKPKKISGIILDNYEGQGVRMLVQDVGPDCTRVKVGDFILVGPGAMTTEVCAFRLDLRLIHEKDVCGVVEYCSQIEHDAIEAQKLVHTSQSKDLHV